MVRSHPMRLLAAMLALAAASLACAAGGEPTVLALHAHAPPSLPGAPGIGYVDLQNTAAAGDTLVQATTPIAERVELHEMTMQGDVMSMRQLGRFPVAPKQTVRIDEASGLHFMFVGLRRPLKAGDAFPLTLTFEHAGTVQTQVVVRPKSAKE